jgi:hypothetical protein
MTGKGRRSQTSERARSGDAGKPKKTAAAVGKEILAVLEKGVQEGKLWCRHYISRVLDVVKCRKEFTKEFLRELFERVNGTGRSWADPEYVTFCDLADMFNSLLESGGSRSTRRRVQIA